MDITSDIDDETQKILDQRYEDAMLLLKGQDLKLYTRLRNNELVGYERNVGTIINEDEQFEMGL
tara:strand:+ start:944 stop:1135 length:192 start_codon:yes stop_codon:yes gene_type:complete